MTDAEYFVFGVGCLRLTQISQLLNKLGIPTAEMLAYCFIKPLPKPAFLKYCAVMGMIGIGLRNGLGNGLGIGIRNGLRNCLQTLGNGDQNAIGTGNGIGNAVGKEIAWARCFEDISDV